MLGKHLQMIDNIFLCKAAVITICQTSSWDKCGLVPGHRGLKHTHTHTHTQWIIIPPHSILIIYLSTHTLNAETAGPAVPFGKVPGENTYTVHTHTLSHTL